MGNKNNESGSAIKGHNIKGEEGNWLSRLMYKFGQSFNSPQMRHFFMFILSAIIVGIILYVSYARGDTFFGTPEEGRKPIDSLVPFFTNLAGVLLFIMNTSRRKRDQWKLRDYWGDHCFRIAQSYSYLFVILWAWGAGKDAVNTKSFSPNILGFLVGFFIIRVERAMESLGDKFEEILVSILPRSIGYISVEERRRKQLRAVYKLDEIASQYDAVRSQIDDPGAREEVDKQIAEAEEAVESKDPEIVYKKISKLARVFDEAKRGLGEMLVPVDELLGAGDKKNKDSGSS